MLYEKKKILRNWSMMILVLILLFIIIYKQFYIRFGANISISNLITPFTIVVAILGWFVVQTFKRLELWDGQELTLKKLEQEVDLLLDKGNKKVTAGHLKYFEDCFSRKVIPSHDIRNIDLDHYFDYIRPKVNNLDTSELKNELIRIYDKIWILNDSRRNPPRLRNSDGIDIDCAVDWTYLIQVIKELEERLFKFRNNTLSKFI